MDIFIYLFIFLITYVILLFILKKINWRRKTKCEKCNNCCPDCQSALNRVQRKKHDFFLKHITFQIFDFRRYICSECGWEGLRWEDKFQSDGR